MPLGTPAPEFSLPNPATNTAVSLSNFAGKKGLLVMFVCNHCPFVVHLRDDLVTFAKEYQEQGLGIVGISSNDVGTHPDDSPERMAEDTEKFGYTFDYLYDESQEVAKAYGAACTPDFFLFDAEMKLAYRGQFDDSRPDSGIPITGADLRAAADAVLAGNSPTDEQKPSIGCNIKWKEGNAPGYFTGQPAV